MGRRYLQEFDKGAHSVYLMYYHLCIVTKYRRKIINADVAKNLLDSFNLICERFNVRINEFNGEPDHVHLLICAKPDLNMSRFIGQLKGRSSYEVHKAFPDLAGGPFWSPSYCLLTTGGAPIDVIKRYIERQAGWDDICSEVLST